MRHLLARGLGKALLGAALLAASLAATPASAETVLTRGFGASPDTLDPHMNFGAREGWIQDDIFEGLTAGNEKGEMVPGAAEKWESSDDGLTWTFHLRDGLKWSNGDPLVAQDFVNGVIRQLDPKTASPRAYYFSSLIPLVGGQEFIDAADKGDPKTVGISAPDDKTIVLKLKAPQPNLLLLVESYHIPPLHKPSFDKYGADFIKPENIVSNGAYMMTENVPQSHVTLVKNPNYWNAANVKIDKVVYAVTEDDQTELKRYKAGELDTTNEVPSDQLDALKAEAGGELRITPYLESQYISFNVTKAPFDNIKVRQALAIGIDRQVLQDKILKAGYQANCGYSPPNDPRYQQPQVPECNMTAAERSEKGKALLAEAGFGPDNPLKVTIESSTDNTSKKMAEGIALMWKQYLGVDAKVNAQEFQAWMNTFYAGGWDVLNDNLIGDMPGPESHLIYMRPSAESGYNWKNDEYENLMNKASEQADLAKRYEYLAQAEKVLLDYYLVTPLDVTTSRHLVKPKVKGWEDNILDTHPSKLMSIEN